MNRPLTGMCSIEHCLEPVLIGFVPICDDFLMVSLIHWSIELVAIQHLSADVMWCVSMRCATISFVDVDQWSFGSELIVHLGQLVVNAILKK